jgi:hypothetical protein
LVSAQRQVLELELIGLVLPYGRQVPVSAAAGPAVATFSPTTAATAAVNPATSRGTRMSILSLCVR